MPRFQDYFNAEADGVHPFDAVQASFDESELGGGLERDNAEKEREQVLYRRELLGKLIGHKLSVSEYEIVAGIQEDAQLRMKRQLDTNNEEFLANRIKVRLMQERVEQIRRQKVIAGEWSENESHRKLAQMLQDWEE